MATAALRLRRDVATLTRELGSDLTVLWTKLETASAAGELLHDVLPALVNQYGLAAGAVAADWYDELRDYREIRGRFSAIPADIPDTGTHALIGWAETQATDYPSFKTLVEGGAQRRLADFARLTVTSSSHADPKARGWVRVGVGECDWCQQYLDGEVRTVAYDFPAHDHCQCQAEPDF